MTDDKLTQDVKSIVDGIFKQKEEVAMRKEIEDALDKSANKINELVETLEAKDTEMSKLEDQVGELEGTIAELSDKVGELEKEKENLEKEKSDFEAEKEELVKQAEEVKTELDNIKKDQLAQARFNELKEAGVAATDEKAVEDQIAKIREMEDEVFETYKEERVELRKSIVAELEASSKEDKESEEEEASEEEGKETNSEEEEASEDTTAELEENEEEAAADSEESIDPMKAVAAMLNMEITPKKEMRDKYLELGKELAKRFTRE
jgi:chromosome segregation ATPase